MGRILDFGKKKNKDVRAEDELSFEEKLTDRTSAGEGGLELAGMFDESKMKRYHMAIEKKALLFDKEDKHGVDYAHMDFILSTGCGFHKGMTPLIAVQLFWKTFYPYLKNITESYENFYDRFRDMIDDQETVLSKHAELDFKYKWTLEFAKVNGFDKKLESFINQKLAEAKRDNPAVPRAIDSMKDLKE